MAIGFPPKYSEGISLNRLPASHFLFLARETANRLGLRSIAINDGSLVARTNNDELSHNAEISATPDFDAAFITSESLGNEMFDLDRNRKNVRKFIEMYEVVRREFLAQDIDALLHEPQVEVEVEKPAEDDVAVVSGEIEMKHPSLNHNFLGFFTFYKGYIVTPSLIYLNIAVYLIMIGFGVDFLDPGAETILKWGGDLRELTIGENQWWRIISSSFLHYGLLHLLLNMVALGYIGSMLEPILGKARFAGLYLLCAAASGVASVWWYVGTASAGASGAIFGMFGVFLALLTTNLVRKEFRKNVLPGLLIYVVLNLLSGLKGQTDNAAHIGGLLFGILCGFAILPSFSRPNVSLPKYISLTALGVFLGIVSFGMSKTVSDDTILFNQKLGEFITHERLALEVLSTAYVEKHQALKEIRDRSDYYWDENLAITEQMDDMELPEPYYERIKMMREYVQLRLENNDLLYKMIDEENVKYKSKIEENTREINEMVSHFGR
ncbi:MAG: rhomboid family intramembrane serine protease [Flavobacterium sp.]|uniref:rhomboid family intramembrane serine protease n=1 Tax=Flavobacterium sp. TaxID=239 RepID=UPI001221453B|nr:rhomboid family intramembrane serine protease [Flavobacterium sp.]RZJ68254.1 MAG: rhomboid family intramembrane serine protease [Flavobacterium sp.]